MLRFCIKVATVVTIGSMLVSLLCTCLLACETDQRVERFENITLKQQLHIDALYIRMDLLELSLKNREIDQIDIVQTVKTLYEARIKALENAKKGKEKEQ